VGQFWAVTGHGSSSPRSKKRGYAFQPQMRPAIYRHVTTLPARSQPIPRERELDDRKSRGLRRPTGKPQSALVLRRSHMTVARNIRLEMWEQNPALLDERAAT